MKKHLFILSLFQFFLGCNSKSQDKAIDELLKVYGGNINSSKGSSLSTDNGSIKYFKVSIENPDFFKNDVDRATVAGGAALMLYNNFTEKERSKYNKYEITFTNGALENYFEFSEELMKEIHTQEKIAKTYLSKLAEGKYEDVSTNYRYPEPLDSVSAWFTSFKNDYGSLVEIQNVGLKMIDYTTKKNEVLSAMQFSGFLLKQSGIIEYSIILDKNSTKGNILSVHGGMAPE